SRLQDADEPAVAELEALLPGLHRDLHLTPRNFAEPVPSAQFRRDPGRTDPGPQAGPTLASNRRRERIGSAFTVSSGAGVEPAIPAGTRTRGTPDPTGRRRSVPA